MSETSPITVELNAELDARLGRIAVAMAKPKSWVIARAVEDFVALQSWQMAHIEAGLEDAAAGRMADHADVRAWVESWDGENECSMPA